jgi:DNA-binding transcriptional ArsR family regulator
VYERELPAGEIAKRFDTTRQAISQHLQLLTEAGVLKLRRVGVKRLYRLRPEAFETVRAFLDDFWDDSLLKLKRAAEGQRGGRRGRR